MDLKKPTTSEKEETAEKSVAEIEKDVTKKKQRNGNDETTSNIFSIPINDNIPMTLRLLPVSMTNIQPLILMVRKLKIWINQKI